MTRAKTLIAAQTLLFFAYVAIICTPPFGVVIASFFLLGEYFPGAFFRIIRLKRNFKIGMGMAMNLALGNVFAANLQNGTTMLGAMHGSYGLGGTVGMCIHLATSPASVV